VEETEGNQGRGSVEQQQDQQQDQQQQQQDQQQQQQDAEMEAIVGSISLQTQIVDMTEWDFDTSSAMKEAMETIRNRKARAIIVSAAAAGGQVNKAIKCAREQGRRGLYFALEVAANGSKEDEEINKAIQDLVNQEGNFVSQEYSIMNKKGAFGWVATKAKIITNSRCVRDKIDKSLAGKHWIRTNDSKRLANAVAKGVNQEEEMTVLEVDGSKMFEHDNESITGAIEET